MTLLTNVAMFIMVALASAFSSAQVILGDWQLWELDRPRLLFLLVPSAIVALLAFWTLRELISDVKTNAAQRDPHSADYRRPKYRTSLVHTIVPPLLSLIVIGVVWFFAIQMAPAAEGAKLLDGQWHARVVRVVDGDTVVAVRGKEAVTIRIAGVDAPERGQAFGERAKELVLYTSIGRLATGDGDSKDRYGRIISDLSIAGDSLSETLLRSGLAWHYREYSKDGNLGRLESEARRARHGLWSDPSPVAPWVWRQAKRNRRTGPTEHSDGPIRGNTSSKIYHRPGCKHYDCKNCTRGFDSVQAAEAQGYRAHEACVAN